MTKELKINLSNQWKSLGDSFYSNGIISSFKKAELLYWNDDLGKELGLDALSKEQRLKYFSGQELLPGSEPVASVYSGHQFGHYNPRLGDGRAVLLGELMGEDRKSYDLQLKGSGPTEYSRGGDGYSSLGPVLREYLLSEYMHKIGIPTTRSLAAVRTNENVYRQNGPEMGGIFTRLASSHIRIGSFQYFAAQNDLVSLEKLLNHSIARHYPSISLDKDLEERCLEFFSHVVEAQASLIAKWMSAGFIHGVMNTDNMSIAGITIDYGPCAFMDHFQSGQKYSSIDRNGRYAFNNQSKIAIWNLARLAECLMALLDQQSPSIFKSFEKTLSKFLENFEEKYYDTMFEKLKLTKKSSLRELVDEFLTYLEKNNLDYTNSFNNTSDQIEAEQFFGKDFSPLYEKLNNNQSNEVVNIMNPIVIPRNHLMEQALEKVLIENDLSFYDELLVTCQSPFTKPVNETYTSAPKKDQVVKATFCGT
ncbi:MAG: YdiU family protein [Bdellovibrionales bacterium]